jgi:hypothetical protein
MLTTVAISLGIRPEENNFAIKLVIGACKRSGLETPGVQDSVHVSLTSFSLCLRLAIAIANYERGINPDKTTINGVVMIQWHPHPTSKPLTCLLLGYHSIDELKPDGKSPIAIPDSASDVLFVPSKNLPVRV